MFSIIKNTFQRAKLPTARSLYPPPTSYRLGTVARREAILVLPWAAQGGQSWQCLSTGVWWTAAQQPATAIKHSHWSTPSPHLPSHWLAPASAGNSLEALINNFVTTFMNKRLDFRLRQNYTGLRIMSWLESWFTAMSETQNRARGGGRLESLHKIIKSQNLVNFKLTFA